MAEPRRLIGSFPGRKVSPVRYTPWGTLQAAEVRPGMPEPRMYVWRPGEAEREEWVRARLADMRAQLAEREG